MDNVLVVGVRCIGPIASRVLYKRHDQSIDVG